jgi:tripartite-type tricarboxylate transporter receptor subunit TctC
MFLKLLGCAAMGTAVAFGGAVRAAAVEYPTHAIRLIVPFAPGGAADLFARMMADPLGKKLGQAVVVENRPGAGATIGAAQVARSAPDGYTLLYTTPGPQITNPYLMKSLPYDPKKDLVPVSMLAFVPSVLVVGKQIPVNSVKELIAYARAHPEKIRIANSGIGATSHLSGELFKAMTGLPLVQVPYAGTGPAMRDLLGGTVEMTIDSVAVYLPYIQSGAVKALGVTTPTELPMLAGVPPIGKDLAGFDASPVNYLSAPAGTPPEIIAKLNAAVADVLKHPDLQKRMLDLGMLPESSSPPRMAKLIDTESEKWKKVIEISGAKLD